MSLSPPPAPARSGRELLVANEGLSSRNPEALVDNFGLPAWDDSAIETGEVGTVAEVNSCYPLRPVVRMDDRQEYEGSGSCEIDLSRMPLVSIAEILYPPVVGRITFSEASPKPAISVVPTTVSDSFTLLLESLDAVALALRVWWTAKESR